MGLKTNRVSDDQDIILDWPGQDSGTLEPPKPPFTRRQLPPQQPSQPPLKCPRCGSTNTKFCYYNNYNKSQPRHFCKSCKRHWTKGGTLRDVPVGGGRKNKRPRISTAAAATSTTTMTKAATASCKDRNNPRTEYPSLPSFDVINNTSLMSNPSSYQSLNDHIDHNIYPANLDPMDESTITTLDIPSGPCPGPDTGNASMDVPSYWNWNEIDDILTSSEDLHVAWDDIDADKFWIN